MSNQMTEEDANTLRAVCESVWDDKYSVPTHMHTLVNLSRKYGWEMMVAYADQFKTEKQGATT